MALTGELAIPGLRHFLYKSRTYVQVTSPAYEGDYVEDENKSRCASNRFSRGSSS